MMGNVPKLIVVRETQADLNDTAKHNILKDYTIWHYMTISFSHVLEKKGQSSGSLRIYQKHDA